MNLRTALACAVTAAALLTTAGCSVTRGQQSVGSYVDDATITTTIKTRFVENKQVGANAIKVETLNGNVILSGFAKSETEKNTAVSLARGVNGVKSVKDAIVVRP
jgi:osmotically-inducible protein OsmY